MLALRFGVSKEIRVAETVDSGPMEKRKPGRRSKGHRKPLHCQMPEPLLLAAQRHAAARGMTLTDLVGTLLSAETGVPYQTQGTLTYRLDEELPQTA